MKRTLVLLVISIVTFGVIFQTGAGAGAVSKTLADRFAGMPAVGESGVYSFDKAHSAIGFKVRHNGLIDLPGFFRDFSGSINYDAKDVSKSSVEFTAKATSIDTGVAGRDNHLRSKDFFEVETYPEVKFKSTKVEKKGSQWIVTGDLTMKGVTKSVAMPFNIAGFMPASERSGARMGITASTKLNRRDYGITYGVNSVISDEIAIDLQIEAPMPRAATPAAPKTE